MATLEENVPVFTYAFQCGQPDQSAATCAAAAAGDDGGSADDQVGHGGHLGAHGGDTVLMAQPLPFRRPGHVVKLQLVPLVPVMESACFTEYSEYIPMENLKLSVFCINENTPSMQDLASFRSSVHRNGKQCNQKS